MASPFVRRPRTEYGILRSISLWVPTDEQIEKANRTAAEKGRVYKPAISLRIEVEPLSYRFDGGTLGNISLKYLPLTYGLTTEDIQAARENGIHGVPPNRIITASLRGGPETEKNVFPRWLKYVQAAGFDIDLDDAGIPVIAGAIGTTFRMQEGEDVFPSSRFNDRTNKWDDFDADGKPYTFAMSNVQYLLAVAKDYVQNPDTVRVIAIRSRDENAEEAAVSSMTSGLDMTAKLREGARASGLVGRKASEFTEPRDALAFCEGAIGEAPILLDDRVVDAAVDGKFIEFLVAQNAVVVGDDGTIIGKE